MRRRTGGRRPIRRRADRLGMPGWWPSPARRLASPVGRLGLKARRWGRVVLARLVGPRVMVSSRRIDRRRVDRRGIDRHRIDRWRRNQHSRFPDPVGRAIGILHQAPLARTAWRRRIRAVEDVRAIVVALLDRHHPRRGRDRCDGRHRVARPVALRPPGTGNDQLRFLQRPGNVPAGWRVEWARSSPTGQVTQR